VARSKNQWSHTSTSQNTPSWRGAQLKKKAQRQLCLYLTPQVVRRELETTHHGLEKCVFVLILRHSP